MVDFSLCRAQPRPANKADLIVLEYHDTYWNMWKEYPYHKYNIRVIEGDFSPDLRQP